ncbi:TPA: hypothetical protein LZR21_001022 [Escherichia coli]|nr:hypothetical protein [Escherichia coli]HBN6544640.1 hypothetical protein [Escherichia coli]
MKRAGEAGKALRAGGGADFIFSASQRLSVSASQRLSVSASQRVVTAFGLCAGALVCLRGVLYSGERVRV